jgi:sugar O-acyltransferase (sialic acid O-acetyltransferase NeuD family)
MKYFIIGNGGFAKEVLFLSKEVFGTLNDFSGFIDYKPNLDSVLCMGAEYPVIDENEFLNLDKFDCSVFLGIGDPKKIKKVVEKFSKYKFPNLIHPNVIMDKSVILGLGNIITAGCILTVDIVIGNFNIINLSTTIGHDTQIKNFNVFNPGSNISGRVSVGNGNLFGTNSTVLQGLNIGDNSTIGASSLINKNVDSNLVVVGVPAKAIKTNE